MQPRNAVEHGLICHAAGRAVVGDQGTAPSGSRRPTWFDKRRGRGPRRSAARRHKKVHSGRDHPRFPGARKWVAPNAAHGFHRLLKYLMVA